MRIRSIRIWIVILLLVITGIFLRSHEETIVPMNRPLAEIPTTLGPWRMEGQSTFQPSVLQVLRPTDYLYRQYRGPENRRVTIYIGYHGGGEEAGPIHSPKHCLPGGGFFKLFSEETALELDNGRINLVQAAYQNNYTKELFLYWYQIGTKTMANEYILRFNEVVNSLTRNRRESTFIRISVPYDGDVAKAQTLGQAFIRDFYPVLKQYIPA